MRLYNTLTKQMDDVLTDDVRAGKRPFGMYVCGPTVQDVPHFGHARAALIPDVMRRLLEHQGITVLHVRNITDVDDKIIAKAAKQGRDPAAVSEEYAKVYERQMQRLGILEPHIAPRATGHIIEMITLIQTLLERDVAYVVDGGPDALPGSDDVLFRVAGFTDYGKLSGRKPEDMLAGARVEPDPRKDNPADFVLWKAAKPGEPSWASPWGPGRPGWHIECSAMALKYLGSGLDLHTGGSDLIFPHHENEIAQSEAYSGNSPFARYWLHNGMLQLHGEKMSKSLGNVVPLREIIRSRRSAAFRLQVLQTHYRAPLNFTYQGLEAAETGLSRLRAAMQMDVAADRQFGSEAAPALLTSAVDAELRFHRAMRDDFDSPVAIAAIFELGRAINRAKQEHGDAPEIAKAQETLRELTDVLGLDLLAPVSDRVQDAAPFIDLLIGIRVELRSARQFAIADIIRDGLLEQGIALEDTTKGTIWKPVERT